MSDFKLFCLIFQPPVTAIPASSQSETVAVKQEKMVSHVRNSRAYSKASLYSSLGYLWTSSLTKERTSSETSREEEKSLFRRLHYQHLNSSNCYNTFLYFSRGRIWVVVKVVSWCVCDQTVGWEGSVELEIQRWKPLLCKLLEKSCRVGHFQVTWCLC